jgi:hypothetical protein
MAPALIGLFALWPALPKPSKRALREGEGGYLLARCSGITQAGTACKGIPIEGSSYCYVHDPAHAEDRRRHGQRGGKRGGRGRPQADLAEVKRRLHDLVEDVLEGAVDRSDAAVVGQLLNTFIRAVSVELKAREQLELIERLEVLEAQQEAAKRSRYGA